MKNLLDSIKFLIVITIKMLTPPIYSFERLENYCKYQIKRNPQGNSPRRFLAGLYKDYKKNEEAKNEYLELTNLGYMSDKDWLNFGEVLCRLEDNEGVIKSLKLIIDKYPKNINANWCLGISYMNKEKYQNAVIYLERAVLAGNNRYEDFWRLGTCYLKIGNLEKAEKEYSKALSLKSDSDELKQNLASIHLKKGQNLLDSNFDKAENEFRKALDLNPNGEEVLRILRNIEEIRKKDKLLERQKILK